MFASLSDHVDIERDVELRLRIENLSEVRHEVLGQLHVLEHALELVRPLVAAPEHESRGNGKKEGEGETLTDKLQDESMQKNVRRVSVWMTDSVLSFAIMLRSLCSDSHSPMSSRFDNMIW